MKLCTLSLSFEWNLQTKDGNPNFQLGQLVMLNAPNLQHLSVNIRYPNRLNHWFYRMYYINAFRFTTNSMLPPIRKLVLHGYSVGLGFSDELEHKLQLPFLQDLTLKTGPDSDILTFFETLTRGGNLCLKVLNIYHKYWCGHLLPIECQLTLKRCFQRFQGLKKFAMSGDMALPFGPVVDAISWHGPSLEILVLYDPNGTAPTWLRLPQDLRVTAQVVQQISVKFTRLRALVLYLHFDTVSRLHATEVWITG